MIWKVLRSIFVLSALAVLCVSTEAFSADIEWKLYIKPHVNSEPVMSKTTREGEEFILRASDCTNVPSGSEGIISSLDGTSFVIQQSPSTDPVSIHIILNVDGNTFEHISGVSLFINLSFEAYVNGEKEEFLTLDRSPLIMTIPQSGLHSLLALCNLSRENVVCVYSSGGVFTDEGIETNNMTSSMTVKMNRLTNTVGGYGEDFGVAAGVKVDTWSKIKLLFK